MRLRPLLLAALVGCATPGPSLPRGPGRAPTRNPDSARAAAATHATVKLGELCRPWERDDCERLCAAGSTLSCARLGRILLVGGASNALLPVPEFEPDPAGARAAWEKACTGGYLPACNELAWLLAGSHGGKAEPERARTLNRRSCDAGLGAACYDLVEPSMGPAAALKLYERGCAAGHAASCLEAGEHYEVGDGVTADMKKALELYGRAFFAPVAATGTLACPPGTRLYREVSEIEFAYVIVNPSLYCGKPGPRRPIKHGPFREWATLEDEAAHPKGVISAEGEYRGGEREGAWVRRDDRGRVRWRGTYRGGKEEGVVEELGPDDNEVERTAYVAGERHGPYRREMGDRVEVGRYEHGKKVGLWVSTRDGKKDSEEPYVDGKLEGDALTYRADGRVEWRTTYRAGKAVLSEGFDAAGRRFEEIRYRDGRRSETRRFLDNGHTDVITYDEEGEEVDRRELDRRGRPVR